MSKTLEELEVESSRILDKDLHERRALLSGTSHLLGAAASSMERQIFKDRNPSARVAILLAVRIANDLRGVSLLTKMGYGMQAASVASSIYEIAYTVAYIGSDDNLAEQWLTHDEVLSTPFGSILKITSVGLSKLGVPDPEKCALVQFQSYTQLCMAKHGNPLLQGQHGFRIADESIIPRNGPDTSDRSVRVCWFTLETSVSSALVAAHSLILNQVRAEKRAPLQKRHDLAGKMWQKLSLAAVQRWGAKDPAPGKWKK